MTAPAPVARMVWIDASRFYAAVGIVLIHSTSDTAGQPYSQVPVADRIGPVIIRCLGEFSSAELFLVFSLFLLAFKIERREPRYGTIAWGQFERLIIPLVAWSIFYAFFRLLKANAFGYAPAIEAELADWKSWLGYLLLGSAQFHLHFLPTLFALVLLYPAMQIAARYPILMIAIFPFLYAMDSVQGWIWGHVADPMARDYLVRTMKILGYCGYGFVAFGIYGAWRRGIGERECALLLRFLVLAMALGLVVKLTYDLDSAIQGQWQVRAGVWLYGETIVPVIVFGLFFASQYYAWSPRHTVWARYTYGIYLAHPIFIDLVDIAMARAQWALSPTVTVLIKIAVVVPLTFALSYALAKLKPAAWLIGLGPTPFLHRFQAAPKLAAPSGAE